ncbi:uncharacterized protein K441DRAFT_674196 [Cenococcum geophilum 1.58]|uniref:uncharacterized protein n=1 Tax=Cenococcum geophilum 1.58 TaxID=794803 RepID=UPI00358FAC55|nr:hypothetical protein K441DRAFT_674196 [Cenococcum geophilum 1.58]
MRPTLTARQPQHSSIPEFILRGLTMMLPLVQKLPDDRMIQIELTYIDGLALIVVWAHHLLELNVVVYDHVTGGIGLEPLKKQFGTGNAQVVVEVGAPLGRPASITLMSVIENGKDELFRLVPDTDAMRIEILRRELLCEYGGSLITSVAAGEFQDLEPVVAEMAHVVCAFAINIGFRFLRRPMSSIHGDDADKGTTLNQYDGMLYDDDFFENEDRVTGYEKELENDSDRQLEYETQRSPPIETPTPRILDATRTVFGGIKMNRKTIDQHLNLYDIAPLNEKLPVPNRLLAMYKRSIGKAEMSEKEQDHLVTIWRRLVEVGRLLAILILALAHVEDLGSCEKIPLICQTEALQDHPLAIKLRTWNGIDPLDIGEYTWYHAIALLLLGHAMPTTLGNVPPALVSSRGWSVYVGTFLQPQTRNFEEMIDPSLISSGRFEFRSACRGGMKFIDMPYSTVQTRVH